VAGGTGVADAAAVDAAFVAAAESARLGSVIADQLLGERVLTLCDTNAVRLMQVPGTMRMNDVDSMWNMRMFLSLP